jgi:basic membrane protein A
VKRLLGTVAMVGAVSLALASCGDRGDDDSNAGDSPSSSTESSSSAPSEQFPDFKACMVSDSGGFDDKSFNQTSHDGLVTAADDFGVQTGEVESQSDSEYADNIAAMVDQDCNIVVTVGFLLGDATEKSAKKNPDVDYAIVDYAYAKPPANLKGLTFNTAQPSFMAGYLAAGSSESGIVGTFGGLNIPTVTIFMDGFWEGVQYYNEQNSTDVQVIGWDEKTQEGSFTEDFENKTKGQNTATNLISQGADVLFPVAGPAGLGALQAAQDDGQVRAIWVDTDGCVSAAEYCDVLLSSVVKGMDVAVEDAIRSSAEGTFDNTPYVGNLENGGVGLAPLSDDVDSSLASELDDIKEQLISGEIQITSPAAPK